MFVKSHFSMNLLIFNSNMILDLQISYVRLFELKFYMWFCTIVLQLCYNQFTGSIPTQLGSLQKLSVLALQYNQLSGAIPASLGGLRTLARLDLSSNRLFGSIPAKIADAPLEFLDVSDNNLSGIVPPGKNVLPLYCNTILTFFKHCS